MNRLKIIKIQIAIMFIAVFSFAQIVQASPIASDNIINLTNQTRKQNKLNVLSVSPELTRAASDKARDMVEKNYWSHQTKEGFPFWIFVKQENYHYQIIGENLAADFKTSEGVMNGWYHSQAHQQNMLNPNYQNIGVGTYQNIVVAYYGKPAPESILSTSKVSQFLINIKSFLGGR